MNMKIVARISFCLLIMITAPAARAADGGDHVLDIQEVVSSKGVKAWLVEDHTLPILSMQFAFKNAGSALDPAAKQGLSTLASNTMDEGAGPYDSATFQKLLTDNSISLSFGGGRDYYSGYLKTLTTHRDLAVELMHLALTKPRFDKDPVERMRAANLARIRSSQSDPDWKAARIMNDVAYAGHPYALNSGGTLTTINNITPEDLHEFVKSRLSRDRLDIGVMGDVTADELKQILDEMFGDLPEKSTLPTVPDISVQNSGKTYLYKEDIPQTIIEAMQPGIGRKDPDFYTGAVMNFILGSSGFGSRLTEEIREKRGLSYGIYTYFTDLEHMKGLSLSTSTKNESAGEVMKLIHQEWARMQAEPVSDKELADAKAYLIGSFPLSLSSTDKIAGMLMNLQADDLPIDYLDHRKERINAVSKEDIQAFAKKLLTPDGLTVVMVGQPQGVTPTDIVEKLPNVE